MRRMPIRHRIAPLAGEGCPSPASCGISRGFPRLYPCGGQVAYVLLTRAPVAGRRVAAPPLPLDLHVLSLSLAFILSQDQTLRCWLSCVEDFLFVLLSLSLSAAPRSAPWRGSRAPGGPDGGRRLCPDACLVVFLDCRKLTGGSCWTPSEGVRASLVLSRLLQTFQCSLVSRAVLSGTALRSYAFSAYRQNV